MINTHGLRIEFGKHKGELWTRIPVNYLKWIRSEGTMPDPVKEIAEAEMTRRGSVTPEVDISGHAIDRASLQCRKIWHETKSLDEGIHAWLCRMTLEALKDGVVLESGKIRYQGMKFVVIQDGCWPVLKTISRA